MYSDPSGHSWKSFWQGARDWVYKTFGFSISYEDTSIINYYFWFDYAKGNGVSSNSDKPISFFANIPSSWWKVWDYSFGVKVNSKDNSYQVFIGTNVGFGWENEKEGCNFASDGSGRFKVDKITKQSRENYIIDTLEINTHNIFGTVVVAIYAPYVALPLIGVVMKTIFA